MNGIGDISMLTVAIIIILLVAIVTVYLVNRYMKRRMRQKSANIKEMSAIILQTLDDADIYVVRFTPAVGLASNMHGNLLPEGEQPLYLFMEMMHTDDCEPFNLFLERLASENVDTGECECRLSNTTAMGEAAGWRTMHCHAISDKSTSPVSVICTLTDETRALAAQQRERELTDRYKLIFDQSFVGLAFFDSDGKLVAINKALRDMGNFQCEDDSFYFGQNMFEMPVFRDIIDRNHVEELYFCTHLHVPERAVNTYLEIRVHPIYDDTGQMVSISVASRDISDERNLYQEGKRNEEELKRANAQSRLYEAELKYLLENSKMLVWRASFNTHRVTFFTELNKEELSMDFSEFVSHIVSDDDLTLEQRVSNMEAMLTQTSSQLYKIQNLLADNTQEWYIMNTIPEKDKHGHVKGCFGLMRNVSSLMDVQEQLRRETERANDSGHLKSVFLANMTHEIRTPLNAIVGFSDVLTMVETIEEKREMVRVIMNNCDMLLRLINDILDLSSMDSSAMALEPEHVDFSKAFNDICETLRQRVQEPGVEFICENPYSKLVTYLDTRRMQQVITNFVTNAVKYTRQGHIKVGYRFEPDKTQQPRESENSKNTIQGRLYMYCEDTGAGIPKEKQNAVFERFVKLNDYVQGTGLGLSICKAIANRSGGKIGVKSEGDGHGSTFWIWVPCEVEVRGSTTHSLS